VTETNAPSDASDQVSGAERYIHSDIFDRLVKDGNDIVGLVAYGLYQQRKRAWIDDFRSQRHRVPSEQELKDYSFGHREDALGALRQEAEGSLFGFSEELIDARIGELKDQAFNARTLSELTDLKGRINHLGGYWHHIVGHLAGFVCLVGIAVVFALIVAFEPSIRELFLWIVERIRGR
jgi:hypothetical protein